MQMVLPEQILIADGDGGKVDALRVDDLNINSFRIISQVDQPLTHEPQEKANSAENSDRPQYAAKQEGRGLSDKQLRRCRVIT